VHEAQKNASLLGRHAAHGRDFTLDTKAAEPDGVEPGSRSSVKRGSSGDGSAGAPGTRGEGDDACDDAGGAARAPWTARARGADEILGREQREQEEMRERFRLQGMDPDDPRPEETGTPEDCAWKDRRKARLRAVEEQTA
jgi:hypothetical protein